MNEFEAHDGTRRALGQLASTMPDNLGRPVAVQRLVRRRHRRRTATRAGVGFAFVAGTGFVLVEAGSRTPAPLSSASAPSPSDSASDGSAPPPTNGVVEANTTSPVSCDALKEKLSNADEKMPDDGSTVKGIGAITAINGGTLTIHLD